MRVDRAREAALDALAACRRNGAWIDGALKQVLKRDGLSGRDAAFASRIAYGVMQKPHLPGPLSGALPDAEARKSSSRCCWISSASARAYQILFMDKVRSMPP